MIAQKDLRVKKKVVLIVEYFSKNLYTQKIKWRCSMKIKIISLVTILSFMLALLGCATIPEEHKGAATGAAIGGATGAVAGALFGGKGAKTETAILGGLAGALVGGLIGHYAYDVKKTKEETAQKYNYQSSMGTMVRLEEVSVMPNTVKPGDKVDLNATYAVLEAADKDINITETREIKMGTELIGKPEVNVVRRGGTYSSTVPLFLPSNAKTGSYSVITTIQSQTAKDSKEMFFSVK
jgi:surface antigen